MCRSCGRTQYGCGDRCNMMTSETLTSQQSKMVEGFIGALSTYTYALDKDRELNEISSIDETACST